LIKLPERQIDHLPASLHIHLPAHAQEIDRSAFNNARIQ